MAMINCPECNKEISDQAISCPYCGYVLKKEPEIRRTQLSSIKKNTGAGIAYLVVGLLILILFALLGPVGIVFGIIMAVIFLSLSVNKFKGEREGRCPYCDKPVKIMAGSDNCKCPSCKKVSVVKDDYLEAVEK